MAAALVPFPPFNFDTHHIVAGRLQGAEASRQHLFSLCIGINDASNGVYLRNTDYGTGAYHGTVHSPTYLAEVNRRVLATQTKADADAVLVGIATQLKADTFPR